MPDIKTQTDTDFRNLQWVEGFSAKPSDISDHLTDLYKTTIWMHPRLIVELGVRDADSSRVLGKAADECDALLIGVDIIECDYYHMPKAIFCKMDDIQFAKRFKDFCSSSIDVLFVDTSHLYEHTIQEIKAFFPLLSEKAVVMFHDTNMASQYSRRDGSTGSAWDNERGVIKAIEEYFDIQKDETQEFQLQVEKNGHHWDIRQNPYCNGFMICYKNCLSLQQST